MSARALARLRGRLLGIGVLGTGLVIWEAWARRAPSFFFPPVRDVAREAAVLWPSADFLAKVAASLERLAGGYAIGAAMAVALGLVLGSSPPARTVLWPTTEFLRALPIVAVLAIAIVLLGDGDAMRVGVIAFGVFFPVLIATVDGVHAVPPETRDTAALLRPSGVERCLRVYLPAALPSIFAGLRTAVSLGLVLVVISEFTGSGDGLGVFIWDQRFLFEVSAMYAGILFLGLLGYVLNRLFLALERHVLAWHYGASGEPAH